MTASMRCRFGAGEQRRGRVAAFGDDRLVAELAHHVVEQPALHGIVVDDQNTLTHHATFCTQRKTQLSTETRNAASTGYDAPASLRRVPNWVTVNEFA